MQVLYTKWGTKLTAQENRRLMFFRIINCDEMSWAGFLVSLWAWYAYKTHAQNFWDRVAVAEEWSPEDCRSVQFGTCTGILFCGGIGGSERSKTPHPRQGPQFWGSAEAHTDHLTSLWQSQERSWHLGAQWRGLAGSHTEERGWQIATLSTVAQTPRKSQAGFKNVR